MGLKPMNCPSHCLVYGMEPRHRHHLPLKFCDFTALHRNEVSGALTGLTRLRQFHQDDAHVFCAEDQVRAMVTETMQMIDWLYMRVCKFSSYDVVLSTRPNSHLGSSQDWDRAESILTQCLHGGGRQW